MMHELQKKKYCHTLGGGARDTPVRAPTVNGGPVSLGPHREGETLQQLHHPPEVGVVQVPTSQLIWEIERMLTHCFIASPTKDIWLKF